MAYQVQAVKSELLETSAWLEAVESVTHTPIKEKQRAVLEELLQKKDVFAVLPRGYGKSVCYGAYPAAYKYFYPEDKPIVLVIYPGDSLPADNEESWFEEGVESVVLKPRREMNKKQIEGIKKGEYSVMFASHKVIRERFWWEIVRDITNYKLLVIDDVHCVSKRSSTYQKDYSSVHELGCLTGEAPILVLSTTATADLIKDVETLFYSEDKMSVVAVPPDRPEIFLGIEKARKNKMTKSLSWYTKLLLDEEGNAPKAIIFARSMDTVVELYFYLMDLMMKKFGKVPRKEDLVTMYHEVSGKETQHYILAEFRQPSSRLRCVVATTCFAYAVDTMDVRYVLHWGVAQDPLSYWQEVSQCSRDGKPGKAITYAFPKSGNKRAREVHDSMLDVVYSCSDGGICLRQKMLAHLALPNSGVLQSPPSRCCSNCAEEPSGADSEPYGAKASQTSHVVM